MIAQSDLVDRFYDGDETGVASNMELATTVGGGTAVIGYGHAVYAYRPPDGEFEPVVFTGWASASKSSNQHIQLLKRDECIEAQGRAKKSDVSGNPDLDYLMALGSSGKDYSTHHSRRDRRGVM